MKRSRLFISSFILGVFVFTLGAVASAASVGPNVFSVGVNGYPSAPDKLLPNAYVNLYSVNPIRAGVYEGVLKETKQTSSNGDGVHFTVNPGEIVNWVAFTDPVKAKYTRHWTFNSPPYKNFSGEDGVTGRLCQTNFLDKTTKMMLSDGPSCGESFSNPSSDDSVVVVATDLSKAGDFEVWPQQTSDPLTAVRDATVYLYDASTNARIGKSFTGNRGAVTFIVERERKFFYDGQKGDTYYGGYQTPYAETPRVFYLTSNGEQIRNSFDNATTSVLRLGAYPNDKKTEPTPTPTPAPTPTPVTPTPTPVQPISGSPTLLYPKEGEVLTNYPRVAYLEWTKVEGAANYEIAVECDICGQSRWSSKYAFVLVPGISHKTIPLAGDNEFRYRVRAVGANGDRGSWSDFRYFKYKTVPIEKKESYSNIYLRYRFYPNGSQTVKSEGKIDLNLSSDYSRRGYNFRDQKYTSVTGGPFYVSDSNSEKLPKFYGNNIGQGGLVHLGEDLLMSSFQNFSPLKFTEQNYNRFGLDILVGHTYAVYDEVNKEYALLWIEATGGFLPKSSPSYPTPVPQPTQPTLLPQPTMPAKIMPKPYYFDEDLYDDFVEIGDEVDLALNDASVQYGKRRSGAVRGLKFKFKVENASEDFQRFNFDVTCDALSANGVTPIVKESRRYDQKPGSRSYSFFTSLDDANAKLVESFKQTGEKIRCTFAINSVVDFATGQSVPDADSSNNAIQLELHWKGGKLRVNHMARQF